MVVWYNNVMETLELRGVVDLLPLKEKGNQTIGLCYLKVRNWVIEHILPNIW